ncbi:hypothetical protein VUR80DRAFT_977 [Thermomyces stellatus]
MDQAPSKVATKSAAYLTCIWGVVHSSDFIIGPSSTASGKAGSRLLSSTLLSWDWSFRQLAVFRAPGGEVGTRNGLGTPDVLAGC